MRARSAAVWGTLGLGLGLATGGCSATPTATPTLTARSTVASYLAAVDAHRWTEAASLLSPPLRQTFSTAPDGDRANTLTVTDVHVRVFPAPFARRDYPGFTDIQQALVTYDATYRKVYGSADGPQTRFVYLGRQGTAGPWRILEVGTGP